MPAAKRERPLIDGFLSDYDFRAAYEIPVNAPAPAVYEHLLASDLHASWIVRLLISLRTGKRIPQDQPRRGFRQRFQGSGFVILAEMPDEELVIGVVGKFWRPDGGRYLDLRPDEFVGFSRPGHAKVAMNFRVRPERVESTVFSTETRILCCDRAAWWKFRAYWALVGPFSGVIRKAMLKQIKREAERAESIPEKRIT